MSSHTVYLCEKPDQGRIIAKALGGGRPDQGGILGDGWSVTWGFGHLMTPFMPHDYDESYKRWDWEPLPIVPKKFEFKPKDGMAGRQLSNIDRYFKLADALVISTDADREGELIAYEIINRLKWTGPMTRLWLSDLTIPAVQKALANTKPAAETEPLYWAAMARTYADWIVGMNMSRASTLKLAAPGAKPMSVGRVQTPVLAMIVDLERKIVNFKPEDYFELAALVRVAGGALKMRHTPPAEKRIDKLSDAQALQSRAQGATGPLGVLVEAKKQAPPPLLDLNLLQQECNSRFGWSADKALKVMQALYETHQILTYPRTDCSALPEEHKNNIPVITGNLAGVQELSGIVPAIASPVVRGSVYDDKKVTAHHAIVPTNKAPTMSALSADEKQLYLIVCKFWLAAHMPDMEYLQTSVTLDANGVPFKASGRQITKEGWKTAFSSSGKANEPEPDADEDADAEKQDENAQLPPLRNGEPATAEKVTIDAKKTKPPSRFTEKTLLQAMKNIAAHVTDPAAKKTLKETSGIGTPATRSNVIETLKTREYITVKKKQLIPTETANVLIDAMRAVAPGYADPVMTARWEDVLEVISKSNDRTMTKKFVDGIAGAVRTDVANIKASAMTRMAGAPRPAPKPGQKGATPSGAKGSFTPRPVKGVTLAVKFDDREKAKTLGARFDGEKKLWVAPEGVDLAPFRAAGFLAA